MIDFKGHRFALVCVRWYLAYPLSYRHLEEMMAERGVQVDHSNIYRWVQKFTPKLEAAFRGSGSKRPLWQELADGRNLGQGQRSMEVPLPRR